MSKKHRFLTWASFFFPIPAEFPVFSRFFSQETLRDENWAQNDSNLRVRAHWAEPVSQQEWQWLSNYANDSALIRWGEKYKWKQSQLMRKSLLYKKFLIKFTLIQEKNYLMNIFCNEMRNFWDPANDHFCGFPADFQNNVYLVLKTRWEYSKCFL